MEAITFGILFGMISLVLFNVLLLQRKADEIKEQSAQKRRERPDSEVDQCESDISLSE